MFKKVIGHQDHSEPKASTTPPPPAPAASSQGSSSATSADRPSVGATRNVLSSDVDIKGTVKFTNDLVVDGKIEGEIQSQGNLTVGENARLKAEINTGTVVVYGKVHGNISATDRVDLKASAEVIGDIKAKTLSIESGAIFVGKSTVGVPSEAAAAGSSVPASAPGMPPMVKVIGSPGVASAPVAR
jgi:cytoskeletal protein CcmA (bactofilin family)